MIGIGDLDAIEKLDFLFDDIGLDTISTGVAIAVAMDAGFNNFGDGPAAVKMVEEVAQGTGFGMILGNGPPQLESISTMTVCRSSKVKVSQHMIPGRFKVWRSPTQPAPWAETTPPAGLWIRI
jgi:aldehyde:ferredoxin oxidoreductase